MSDPGALVLRQEAKLAFLGNGGLGWEAVVQKEAKVWGNGTISPTVSQDLFVGRKIQKG